MGHGPNAGELRATRFGPLWFSRYPIKEIFSLGRWFPFLLSSCFLGFIVDFVWFMYIDGRMGRGLEMLFFGLVNFKLELSGWMEKKFFSVSCFLLENVEQVTRGLDFDFLLVVEPWPNWVSLRLAGWCFMILRKKCKISFCGWSNLQISYVV
jgi:hypothetical protein